MVQPDRPPANNFVRLARKIYNPLGFSKGYNFILWFHFAGALLGFVLARFEYLNFTGIFCGSKLSATSHAAPGECYYYLAPDHERVGIIMHLAAMLPAGFLAFFQFLPVLRHKIILFHRINGYIVITLSFVATVGALMIARNAFGGDLSTQVGIGMLAIVFLGSLVMAYINIKRLQIEQHRIWMLRAWFYAGSIITLRMISFIVATFISSMSGYVQAQPCPVITQTFDNETAATLHFYPECEYYYNGSNPNQYAVTTANINGTAIEAGTALDLSFGAALWLAFALHAIGIEIYLKLTPAEHERLRNLSYERQRAAGIRNPGNAGLTIERFGDSAKWERPRAADSAEYETKALVVGVEHQGQFEMRSYSGADGGITASSLERGQISNYGQVESYPPQRQGVYGHMDAAHEAEEDAESMLRGMHPRHDQGLGEPEFPDTSYGGYRGME